MITGPMKKSMRKADAKLAEARKYVASYKLKSTPAPKLMPVVEPVDVETETETDPKCIKIESTKIVKLEKGHFFIIVSCKGKQHKIQKRFKSVTKAQEWILKHDYIEL